MVPLEYTPTLDALWLIFETKDYCVQFGLEYSKRTLMDAIERIMLMAASGADGPGRSARSWLELELSERSMWTNMVVIFIILIKYRDGLSRPHSGICATAQCAIAAATHCLGRGEAHGGVTVIRL